MRSLVGLFLLCSALSSQPLPSGIESQFPLPGASGVAPNTTIVFRFSSVFSFNPSQVTVRQTGTSANIALIIQNSAQNNTSLEIVFRPVTTLAASTSYSVSVSTPIVSSYEFTFTTGPNSDTTPPRLVSISPGQNSVVGDPSGPFLFQFDEPIQPFFTGFPAVIDGTGTSLEVVVQLSADRRTLEIRPFPRYRAPAVLQITFNPASVRDLAGNAAVGELFKLRYLTSIAGGGPHLLGQYPAPGQTSVPTNSVVQLLFDRDLSTSSPPADAVIFESAGQALKLQPRVSGSVLTLAGVTLTPDTRYRARISSQLLDADGLALAQPVDFEFTTTSGPEPEPVTGSASGPAPDVLAPVNARVVIHSARRLPGFAPLLFPELRAPPSSGSVQPRIKVTATLLDDFHTLVLTPIDPLPVWSSLNFDFSRLTDTTADPVRVNASFKTTAERDEQPPRILTFTPGDRDVDVPVTTPIKIQFQEAIGLMTPSDAVKLLKNGDVLPGQVVITVATIEFRPSRPLDPGSDYGLNVEGVADLAGNVMAAASIAFRTAVDSTPPRDILKVVRSSLESGDPNPRDPIEVQFSLPLQASSVAVTIAHPFRTEIAGDTVRVIPAVPWGTGRDYNLSISAADRWGRYTTYSASFRLANNSDTVRPEVISITPPPGTSIRIGQPIRIDFSKPMLRTTVLDGGLVVVQGAYTVGSVYNWSDDWQSVTITNAIAPAGVGQPVVVVASAGLTDLSGNRLVAVTARFPVEADYVSQSLATVRATLTPPCCPATLDLQEPITLLLDSPIDATFLSRSLWVETPAGRVAGEWQTSGDGLIATFRPQAPWPLGSTVRLVQIGNVLGLAQNEWPTKASARQVLTLIRTSFSSLNAPYPANAVIEVEFNQDIPITVSPLILTVQVGRTAAQSVAFDESQPRPRVRRLTPRSALPVGGSLFVAPRAGVTIEGLAGGFVANGNIGPALTGSIPEAQYRAPLSGVEGVALNAHVSIRFTDPVNALTLTDSTARITSGGRLIPARIDLQAGGGYTITPLELLPSNTAVDVRVDGVEDLLGRKLAPMGWSFRTGNGLDLTPPRLLYSNAIGSFDPQSSLRLQFDEPLDPAKIANWELSSDLTTLILRPQPTWGLGEAYNLGAQACDLSGACGSYPPAQFTVAFDRDTSPLVLRGVSPPDGFMGAPLNVAFSLLFNKPIASSAIGAIRLVHGSERIELAEPRISTTGRITFTPAAPLDPNTDYQLILDGVRDSTGNSLASRTIRFTTGERFDTVEPIPSFRFLSRSTPLRVRFNEPMDPTGALDAANLLTWNDTANGVSRNEPLDVAWSPDYLELILTPLKTLQTGKTYTLNLNFVTDLAGRAVTRGALLFNAVENPDTGPVRVSIYPADGSTNTPINVLMAVKFSRGVDTPPIRLYESGKLVLTLPSQSSTAVGLTRSLQVNQSYRIEVDSFNDEYDNPIPAASSSFTTGLVFDSVPPQFVSSTPVDGAAGVAPETPWQLTFNEPLSPYASLDFPVQSGRAIPTRYTTEVSREQFTIRPSPAWPAASTIQLSLFLTGGPGLGSLRDWAGNLLRQPVSLSFRTAAIDDAEQAVLESASPPSGAQIPGLAASVDLRFSKPVGIEKDGLQIFYGANRVNPEIFYSQDLRTITVTLRPPANSRVTLVGNDAILDIAGHPVAPFVLEYPTGENQVFGFPTVSLVEPRGLSEYPASSTVLIRFDRVMDAESVRRALRLTQNGENVSGSIEVSESGRAYRFRPSSLFAAGATVKVFVLPAAVDLQGTPIAANPAVQFSFTIEGRTQPLSIVRRGFGHSAPADAVLEVEFSSELAVSSVREDSVWLRSGSRLIRGRTSLRDGSIVQFTPDSVLEPGGEYVLTLGAALRAFDGREFGGEDLRVRAVEVGDPAEVESIVRTQWRGRAAVRVRFTQPVSALSTRGLRLVGAGRNVEADVFLSADQREIWLIPADSENMRAAAVSMTGVAGRNGLPLPSRAVDVPREER